MTNGLVSIITPCYNSAKFIKETVQSVQNQSYENWEMLIVDDCSTDNSIEVLQEISSKDKRLKYFKLSKNGGPAVARNKAITESKGQYLAFLDSDDLWYPNFLETSISVVKSSEGFVFASYERVDEETLKPVHKDFIVPSKVNYYDILKTNSISCLTAFIDAKKLGKKQMPNVRYRQDMGLWLSYLKQINYAIGIKEVLAKYRIRKISHSRNKKKLLKPQWYFYRNVEKLSMFQSIYYMIIWAYRGFKKYQ